jgi:uncharacterized protein (TIGR02996 family)
MPTALDRAALLAAVCAAPEDDLPRLAYADWCEDNGEAERAELIRVQLEIANLGGLVPANMPSLLKASSDDYGRMALKDDERELALRRRERELLTKPVRSRPDGDGNAAEGWSGGTCEKQWGVAAFKALERTGLLYTGEGKGMTWQFRRGFVASVTLPCADWLRHGAALVRACPLEEVRLSDRRPSRGQGSGRRPKRCAWMHPDVPRLPAECGLPLPVFEALEGGPGSVPRCKWYDSEADALAALSRACLRLARAGGGP